MRVFFRRGSSYRFVLLAAMLTAVAGCGKKTTGLNFHLNLALSETISNNDRSLCMNFWSNSLKERAGFRLRSHVSKASGNINITLSTIAATPPSKAPLETTAVINRLENRRYNVTIRLKEHLISGHLMVDKNTYQLDIEKNTLLTVKANKLNKLPLNTIYGSVHYYSPSSIGIVNGFLAALKKSGAVQQSYFPGSYGLFTIGSNGQIDQKNDSGYLYTKKFIYRYLGDDQKLKELVKKYAFEHTTDLMITLRTYDGQLFNLWSVNN